MGIIFIILLAVVVHSEHVDEDKWTLKSAAFAAEDNLQKIDVKADKTADVEVVNGTKKLKEFQDHAELKAEDHSSADPVVSLTPSPKIVANASTNEEIIKDDNSTALQPETLPTPVPVQLNPVTDVVATKDEVYFKYSTKKPSVVGKKGVVYEEPSVVGKKGADPENLKPSVTARKGADPETKKPSVTPRKEAVPSPVVDLDKTVCDNTTTNCNVSVDVAAVKETGKMTGNKNTGVTSEKFKATDFNMLTTEKGKNLSQVPSEFDMKFAPSSSKPNLASNVTVLPSTSVSTPTVDQIGPEPVKPLTADPVTTETVTTTKHSKPAAATDTLENTVSSTKNEFSYTPAIVGIVLLIAIIVTVIIVGYRRLQDVWMRRHYARMDFLIDGMYDV